MELIAGLTVTVALLALDNLIAVRTGERGSALSFVLLSLLCAAVTALVAVRLAPKAEEGEPGRHASHALLLGLAALLTLIVYWTGLPLVLAAGGIAIGRIAGRRAQAPRDGYDATAAVLVSAIVAGIAVVAFVIAALD